MSLMLFIFGKKNKIKKCAYDANANELPGLHAIITVQLLCFSFSALLLPVTLASIVCVRTLSRNFGFPPLYTHLLQTGKLLLSFNVVVCILSAVFILGHTHSENLFETFLLLLPDLREL